MAEGKNDKSRKDEAQSGGRRAAAAAHNFAEASRDAAEAGGGVALTKCAIVPSVPDRPRPTSIRALLVRPRRDWKLR